MGDDPKALDREAIERIRALEPFKPESQDDVPRQNVTENLLRTILAELRTLTSTLTGSTVKGTERRAQLAREFARAAIDELSERGEARVARMQDDPKRAPEPTDESADATTEAADTTEEAEADDDGEDPSGWVDAWAAEADDDDVKAMLSNPESLALRITAVVCGKDGPRSDGAYWPGPFAYHVAHALVEMGWEDPEGEDSTLRYGGRTWLPEEAISLLGQQLDEAREVASTQASRAEAQRTENAALRWALDTLTGGKPKARRAVEEAWAEGGLVALVRLHAERASARKR